MKLKVCGMKYLENIQQVAALQPDYLGFIFYEKSKRNFDGDMPSLPDNIKRVGVFVNASLTTILEKVKKYKLNALQLHGDETPEFCNLLKIEMIKSRQNICELVKVFSVGNNFDFSLLKPYEDLVDYFLFDTKGKEKGGNGVVFNWQLLEKYSSQKPYFLSGGIGLEEIDNLKSFREIEAFKYCYALDVNSRFEDSPGLKNIEKLKEFKSRLL